MSATKSPHQSLAKIWSEQRTDVSVIANPRAYNYEKLDARHTCVQVCVRVMHMHSRMPMHTPTIMAICIWSFER